MGGCDAKQGYVAITYGNPEFPRTRPTSANACLADMKLTVG